jgi:glycosyltransferase involved in cell wall biosynthesis
MVKSAHLTGPVSRQAGGLFGAISRLAQLQYQQGMQVRVFGLWDKFTELDGDAWSPISVSAFKQPWLKLVGPDGFLSELGAFAPDIMHTHGLWLYSSIAARKYSRANKRPYFISPHGMLDPWAVKNSAWKKKLALLLYECAHLRNAACLRALCKSEARSVREFGLKNPICVIPNGIDMPTESVPFQAPWKDAVVPGCKVLLFLSRIHPKKGLVNLLKAWGKNRQLVVGNGQSVGWALAIAGWDQGGHEADLKRLCTELSIPFADIREPAGSQQSPGSVLFLGPQFGEAKAACYHRCDAFVLPSFSEGLPMVVLEAWAHAKPVIMTPECNLPEGLSVGAALKVEATELSLMAGLNEFCHMTAGDRLAMGSRGRDLVLKQFTWTKVAEEMKAAYLWVLGGGAKPDCLSDV